jgi:hypothetical protein
MALSQSINLGNAKSYINENNSLVFKNVLLQKGVSISGYNYSLEPIGLEEFANTPSTIDSSDLKDQINYFNSNTNEIFKNIIISRSGTSWKKVGNIGGEEGFDRSGQSVSISEDGTTVAIGAPENSSPNSSSPTNFNSGHIRVYKYKKYNSEDIEKYNHISLLSNNDKPIIITPNNSQPIIGNNYWTQLGSDISGLAANDQLGRNHKCISLSLDGLTLATGSTYFEENGSVNQSEGVVIIWQYDTTQESWLKKGSPIQGAQDDEMIGLSVSINGDGNIVAFSRDVGNNIGCDVYEFNTENSSWIQKGLSFGEGGKQISLSKDGLSALVTSFDRTNIRVYHFVNNIWTIKGNDFTSAGNIKDSSMNYNGSTISICSTSTDNLITIEIFNFDNEKSIWTNKGNVIHLQSQDQTIVFGGHTTVLKLNNDGSTLIVGSRAYDGDIGDIGLVEVFEFQQNSNSWNKIFQVLGDSQGDTLGWSIDINSIGNIIVIGIPQHDTGGVGDNGSQRGKTEIYEIEKVRI